MKHKNSHFCLLYHNSCLLLIFFKSIVTLLNLEFYYHDFISKEVEALMILVKTYAVGF